MHNNEPATELEPPQTVHNFIGGNYRETLRGEYCLSMTAHTQTPCYRLPRSRALDVDRAIDAACHALPVWSRLTRPQRLQWLNAAARHLAANRHHLERAEQWDFETLTPQCAVHAVTAAIEALRHPADSELAVPQADRSLHPLSAMPAVVTKQLVSSDSELLPIVQRIAPLLAKGNVLVVGVLHKPATPPTVRVMRLLGLMAEQLPPGVLNAISGMATEMGSALIHNERAVTTPLVPLRAGCGANSPEPGRPRFILH